MKVKNFELKKSCKHLVKKYKTRVHNFYKNEEEAKDLLAAAQTQISDLQKLLFAERTRAVLLILQGTDTAGKDGLIKHVLSGINPMGCEASSFQAPSVTELQRDFLLRLHERVPRRGKIGIFNRSYYEDVIVPFVHPDILEDGRLPKQTLKSKNLLLDRCKDIVNFESYLTRQGYVIIKLFLHLSKEEQRIRLLERVDTPDKNWKLEEADIEERKYWKDYQRSYDFCLSNSNHKLAPWYVVPADDKINARLIASQIIIQRMKQMKLAYPKLTTEKRELLEKIRNKLSEKDS